MGTMNENEASKTKKGLHLPSSPVKNEPKLLQIVGFKNSGKTTLTEMLLRRALELGWVTSAIKRHGHGGTPDLPPAETDASRLFEAGAASSIVSGGGILLLQGRQLPEEEDVLEPLISLTRSQACPDLILIEGFKDASHPKIVLVRSAKDWMQLSTLSHIRLIVTVDNALAKELSGESADADWADGMISDAESLPVNPAIRVLSREQSEDIAAWFADWLRGEKYESL